MAKYEIKLLYTNCWTFLPCDIGMVDRACWAAKISWTSPSLFYKKIEGYRILVSCRQETFQNTLHVHSNNNISAETSEGKKHF